MAESVPSTDPGAQKRRSTRIVQAVPLTVTGVDALGQAFRERTSSLVVNCHGCSYQSRHYALKNTWVSLEIPHPEAGQEARRVRARVAWIQRPRTVRELFQVGVELEVPGNVWGIAFPPPDWFPFPEPGVATLPVPAAEPQARPVVPAALREPAAEAKVRELPRPGQAEVSAVFARQMARLLAEAKQQMQQTVRELANSAVAAETSTLMGELSTQLQGAAAKAVEASASAYADHLIRTALAKIDEARQTGADALREQWAHQVQRDLHESSQHLVARLAEIGENFRSNFAKQLETDVGQAADRVGAMEQLIKALEVELHSSADAAQAQLDERAKHLHAEINATAAAAQEQSAQLQARLGEAMEGTLGQWREKIAAHEQEARDRLNELKRAARKLSEDAAAAVGKAHEGWRERLESDMAAAGNQWNHLMESSIESAAQRAAERLAQISLTTTASAEQEFAARAARIRQSLEQLRGDVEQAAASLQTSLEEDLVRAKASCSEINTTAARVEEFTTRLEDARRTAVDELDRRFESIFAAHSAELNQRAESLVAQIVQRLEPTFEEAGQGFVARFVAQVEEKLAPELKRAEGILEKLGRGEDLAEEALRVQRDRLHGASEQYVRESITAVESTLTQLQKDFDRTGREALAKMSEEMEAKATDATHTTFEALYKASEWYQKKAQVSMQSVLEKSLEQATNSLRDKAASVSGIFASELDHYSRSYVEHTQGQLEETSREVLGGLRQQLQEAAETTAAALSDEAHRIAEDQLVRFAEASNHTVEDAITRAQARAGETTAQLENAITRVRAHADQSMAQMDAHAEQSLGEFRQRLGDSAAKSLEQGRQDFEASLVPSKEAWRAEHEARQREALATLARLSDESVQQYKQRLENVSNTWMVTSVTTLSERSHGVLDALAAAAEQRLRETCAQVFTGVAEALRQRLLGISSDLQAGPPPGEKK